MKISRINARQILDSRGTPTVEAEVWCGEKIYGRAAVPSGASTGEHEAHELRDGNRSFFGKGVNKAVENVNSEIAKSIVGMSVFDQGVIDKRLNELDGTDNKARLGANAILAVSLAAANAASALRGIPLFRYINELAGNVKMSLPMPMMNLLNGGRHAHNSSDFQEYMIIPVGAKTYIDALSITADIYGNLKEMLMNRGLATTVGDEGGFALPVKSNVEMFELLREACLASGHTPGESVYLAVDVAASEFFKDGKYVLHTESRNLTSDEMIKYLEDISEKFGISSIEDGLAEDEWDAWKVLTARLKNTQIVGDDLLVTNKKRLEYAIENEACNAILIKPNQIGTLSETIETISVAKEHNMRTVISHRSGETEDVAIAHLAVGVGAGQIKTGSIARGERTAKHNELLRIEDNFPELTLT